MNRTAIRINVELTDQEARVYWRLAQGRLICTYLWFIEPRILRTMRRLETETQADHLIRGPEAGSPSMRALLQLMPRLARPIDHTPGLYHAVPVGDAEIGLTACAADGRGLSFSQPSAGFVKAATDAIRQIEARQLGFYLELGLGLIVEAGQREMEAQLQVPNVAVCGSEDTTDIARTSLEAAAATLLQEAIEVESDRLRNAAKSPPSLDPVLQRELHDRISKSVWNQFQLRAGGCSPPKANDASEVRSLADLVNRLEGLSISKDMLCLSYPFWGVQPFLVRHPEDETSIPIEGLDCSINFGSAAQPM